MIVKAFRDWKFEEVELTFGIEQVLEHPVLTDWLSANAKPSAVSDALVATQDDIFQIYSAMVAVQQRVAELVA